MISEIDEINTHLNEKYRELDKYNKEIKSTETELEAVKSTFSHELNKIDIKTKEFMKSEKLFQNDEISYLNRLENNKTTEIFLINKIEGLARSFSYYEEIKQLLTIDFNKYKEKYDKFSIYFKKEKEKLQVI